MKIEFHDQDAVKLSSLKGTATHLLLCSLLKFMVAVLSSFFFLARVDSKWDHHEVITVCRFEQHFIKDEEDLDGAHVQPG